MANTLQAKKRTIQSLKRRAINRSRKTINKNVRSSVVSAIKAKDPVLTAAQFQKLQSSLDRSASRGTIHKNKAARIKSNISKHVKMVLDLVQEVKN